MYFSKLYKLIMKIPFKLNKKSFKGFFSKITNTTAFTIAKKEFRGTFTTPLGFVLICLFIIITSVVLYGVLGFLKQGNADLSLLFSAIGFAFILIIPAFTMSSFSREKMSGTIEFVLGQPIKEIELLTGKFLVALSMIAILLITTIPFVIIVAANAETRLDIGQIVVQYLGAFLLGGAFASIGLAFSAIFKSETLTLLVTIVVSALFIVTGSTLIPVSLSPLFSKISLLTQYQSISRGVIDLRDLLYFVVFITAFLSIAYLFIVKIKFSFKSKFFKQTLITAVIFVGITVLLAFLGNLIPGRIDLTSGGLYTLSDVSVKTVSEIGDILNINLFASNNLPLSLQGYLRSIDDWLTDYKNMSNGKINYQIKKPDIDESAAKEAEAEGISPFQLSVQEDQTSQSSSISYFAINFKYKDKKTNINFFTEPSLLSDLEYTITKSIKEITNENKKTIAFLTTGTLFNNQSGLTYLNGELSKIFNVEQLDLSTTPTIDKTKFSAIIISGASSDLSSEALSALKTYFSEGGSIFLMAQGMNIYMNTETEITEHTSNILSLFADYGITINKNVIYDLSSNNKIPQGNMFMQSLVNYPFWILSKGESSENIVLRGVDNLSNLWASSLTLDLTKTGNTKLLTTSSNSGEQNLENLNVNISTPPVAGSNTYSVAALIENVGKAVVIGDSEFVEDTYLSSLSNLDNYESSGGFNKTKTDYNLTFALNVISWLTGEDSIGAIKSKNRIAPRLINPESYLVAIPLTGSVVPFVAVILLGGLNFYLRDKKNKEVYNAL